MKIERKEKRLRTSNPEKDDNYCPQCNKLQTELTNIRIENEQLKKSLQEKSNTDKFEEYKQYRKTYCVLFPQDINPLQYIVPYKAQPDQKELSKILNYTAQPYAIFLDAIEYSPEKKMRFD